MDRYVLEIRKTDLALLTFLNDGVAPPTEPRNRYLVIDIDKKTGDITTKIVTHREMLNLGELAGILPLLLKFKK